MDNKRYIAENNQIGFVQYTHDDDTDMFACWQDCDTQKGYNYAFDGSLNDLNSIDITTFPFWVVAVDKSSGAKIGVLRLSSGEEQDLAIWIYPQHRGKGYGTEAFSLAVNHIFCNMNLRKIYAGCYCDNKASLRMLEKVGFIRNPVGDQQEENCFTGKTTIQLSFVLTINDGIHGTNNYERSLFGAVKERFNNNLYRWYSEVRPDHYNSNFFTPISDLTRQDVLAAVAFQNSEESTK